MIDPNSLLAVAEIRGRLREVQEAKDLRNSELVKVTLMALAEIAPTQYRDAIQAGR